jgi:hypothetical protein
VKASLHQCQLRNSGVGTDGTSSTSSTNGSGGGSDLPVLRKKTNGPPDSL